MNLIFTHGKKNLRIGGIYKTNTKNRKAYYLLSDI